MTLTQIMRSALAGLLIAAGTLSYGQEVERVTTVDTTLETPAAGAEGTVETTVAREEVSYYDAKFSNGARYIFYNFRDGMKGLFTDAWQLANGVVAGTGIVTGKILVCAGDWVGMVDDNLLTKSITRGAVSDIIEQASYYDFRIVRTLMLASHGIDDIPIVVDPSEYTIDGDEIPFKTRLYLRPWAMIVLPATVLSDALIRPVGHIALMFSIRGYSDMEVADIPTQLDQFGLDLIRYAYNERLFFPIPEEEEPDFRIYTEEGLFNLEPTVVVPDQPNYRP